MRPLLFVVSCAGLVTLGMPVNSAGTVVAQEVSVDAPSLGETLMWLRDRVDSDGGLPSSASPSIMRTFYRPLEFTSCTISWSEVAARSPVTDRSSDRVTIPLADVDPTKIQVEARPIADAGQVWGVLLATKGRKGIRAERGAGVVMVDQVSLVFADLTMAQRIAQAFARASTLCAREPF